MSDKLIVNWEEYNKTVEKLAIQIHDSGYKPSFISRYNAWWCTDDRCFK